LYLPTSCGHHFRFKKLNRPVKWFGSPFNKSKKAAKTIAEEAILKKVSHLSIF
jgi:hypothetical protein